MNSEEIFAKWRLKGNNKEASVDMWNSMAQSFNEQRIPSFADNKFLQLLQRNNMFSLDSLVLDVGCGPGKYTLALAERCKKCVGVDLSPRMIEIAKQKKVEEKLENIEFYCADWHEVNLQQMGFEKKFDLVFAHLTPAVQSADTFQKLLSASKGWCVLSKPTHRTDPVSDKVKKLVGITEKRESCNEEILFAFELLWRQGMFPCVTYEKQRWSMQKTLNEAYGMYINRAKTYRNISLAEEEIIKQYLQSIAVNGLICEEVDTTITTLYWHVEKEVICNE